MIKWKRGNHLAANKGPRRDRERKTRVKSNFGTLDQRLVTSYCTSLGEIHAEAQFRAARIGLDLVGHELKPRVVQGQDGPCVGTNTRHFFFFDAGFSPA